MTVLAQRNITVSLLNQRWSILAAQKKPRIVPNTVGNTKGLTDAQKSGEIPLTAAWAAEARGYANKNATSVAARTRHRQRRVKRATNRPNANASSSDVTLKRWKA